MWRFCAVCAIALPSAHPRSSYICSPCVEGFSRSTLHLDSGSSIFRYQGPLRSLILRAKVGGDRYALAALRSIFLADPTLAAACAEVTRIIPLPSSLWGRLRGRIDIAWFLAEDAAKKFGCALYPAPWSTYWRIKKRALATKNNPPDIGDTFLASPRRTLQFSGCNATIPTLLIDDIVTTGFTLTHVASRLENSSCRFFTLAEAYTQRVNTHRL